jgi:glycosyltransferase involved in cell wall biosynthesis
MTSTPLISVITVVYNAENLIEKTLRSVLAQTYPNVENLIVDGNSKDNTLQIIQNFKDNRVRIISEPDKGIYDAMNKGMANAKGDYIIFINAGDEFYAADTLSTTINSASNADVYYGNTAVINSNGEILGDRRLFPPDNLNWRSLRYGMCVSHQSLLVKKSIAPKYDLDYKISADIDWVIRTLQNAQNIVNTHNYISRFLEGGVSSSRRKLALKERFSIMKKHYGLLQTLWSHLYIILRFIKHRLTKKSMT